MFKGVDRAQKLRDQRRRDSDPAESIRRAREELERDQNRRRRHATGLERWPTLVPED